MKGAMVQGNVAVESEEHGTKLYSVCGNIQYPGTYEVVMGFRSESSSRRVRRRARRPEAQGSDSRRCFRFRFKRWKKQTPRSWITRALSRKGSMLGSGGVIVIDDKQSMVRVIARLARFFAHESCAQCTQCREGTAWTTKILERIRDGQGTMEDLDTLLDLADLMTGTTICVLSDSCAVPVVSGIKKFRPEFEGAHPRQAGSSCAFGGRLMTERKMVNLTIEGRPVSVPEGTSILEAAKAVGILIPHYCYHPGLPVAGVCRMCLVEVEKAPKLAPVVRHVR
jgi:hypothetical protein